MNEVFLAMLVGGLIAVPAAVAASALTAMIFTGLTHLSPDSGWLPYTIFPLGLVAYVAAYVVAGLGLPVTVAVAIWPGTPPAVAAGAGAAAALLWRVIRKEGVG